MASLYATYDGSVLRPEEPLPLAPNTRVWLTIETPLAEEATPALSFLETARAQGLDGPEDWSERLESYLYPDAEHGSA